MDSLQLVWDLYKAMSAVNRDAIFAPRFAHLSSRQINERITGLTLPLDQETLMIASLGMNTALFRAYLKESKSTSARTLAFRLATGAVVYQFLDENLKKIGTSYAQASLERKRLLSPKDVDDLVQAELPQNAPKINSLADKLGLVTVSPCEDTNIIAVCGFDIEVREVWRASRADSMKRIKIGTKSNMIRCKDDLINQAVSELGNAASPSGYNVVICDPRLQPYIMTRFIIDRNGREADNVFGLPVSSIRAVMYDC